MLVTRLILTLILIQSLFFSNTAIAYLGDESYFTSSSQDGGRPPALSRCGDGECQTENGEECDDGDEENGPLPKMCSSDCKHNNKGGPQGAENLEIE